MKTISERYFLEVKSIFLLAYPIILGQVGIMLMGFADTVQVGRMNVGAVQAIAAAADANGIWINITIIGYICLQVVSPLISKAQAGNNEPECGQLLRANIRAALIMAITCSFLVWLASENMAILKQPIEIRGLTKEYLNIIIISTLPSFLFTAIKSFTDGLEKTFVGMFVTFSALILNVFLNHCFINGIWFFPKWGLYGAGIATLISRIYMAVAIAWYVFRNPIFKQYLVKNIAQTKQIMISLTQKILKLGIPAGFQGFFEIAAFYGAVVMMGWISIHHKAAHQVAIGFASLTYMAATGISAAGGIRVGAAVGERNRTEIFRSGTAALLLVIIWMSFCGISMVLGKELLVNFVIKDTKVVVLAVQLMVIGGFFQLVDGIQSVSLGILRGISDVNIPTFITLIAYWVVGLPMCYYLGFVLDMKHIGVWIGLTVGLTISAILLSWRFYNKIKRIELL